MIIHICVLTYDGSLTSRWYSWNAFSRSLRKLSISAWASSLASFSLFVFSKRTNSHNFAINFAEQDEKFDTSSPSSNKTHRNRHLSYFIAIKIKLLLFLAALTNSAAFFSAAKSCWIPCDCDAILTWHKIITWPRKSARYGGSTRTTRDQYTAPYVTNLNSWFETLKSWIPVV